MKWNTKKEGDDGASSGYGTVCIFIFTALLVIDTSFQQLL